MKSTIVTRIKHLRFYGFLIILFYVIYNTYYGWNESPVNEMESYLDKATIVAIYFLIGLFISIAMDFMKLVVQFIINETKKNNDNLPTDSSYQEAYENE